MTSPSAAHPPRTRQEPSTEPRPRPGHGAVLAVIGTACALLVILTGCGSNDAGPVETSGDAGQGVGARPDGAAPRRASTPGHCTAAIGAVSVDEVHVPDGATCRLLGTTVTGNVSIGPRATLVARKVAVDGDVEGQAARQVIVSAGSSIGGNLQLEQGGFATVSRARVRGDLQWTMQAGPLTIRRTLVTGNLQAHQNRGWLVISKSRIGGDLQCHQNTRPPIQRGNVVGGLRDGQCAPVRAPRPPAADTSTGPPPAAPQVHAATPRPPCAGDSVSDDPSDDQCGED